MAMNTPSPGPGSPPGYNGPSDTPYQPIHQAPTQAPYQDPQKTPHDGLHSPPAPAYGPSDSHDAGAWNQPAQVPHASAPGLEPGKWHESYCGFCSPFDVCMMAWCFPCVTFGKTHHRLRWGNNMENYEPFNTSCFAYCGALCCGVQWIPQMMQRSELREKHNIDGNCCADCCSAFCCPLCDLVQADKEATFRENLRSAQGQAVTQQYQPQGGMSMPSPTYQPPAQK